jgi:hypothetical protein
VVQFQEHVILEKQFNEHKTSNVIFKKAKIGRNNLNVVKDSPSSRFLGDGEVIEFNPGNRAPPKIKGSTRLYNMYLHDNISVHYLSL